MLAQVGQGILVQEETTSRKLETMNKTTQSAITGIPIVDLEGKRRIRASYGSGTFSNTCSRRSRTLNRTRRRHWGLPRKGLREGSSYVRSSQTAPRKNLKICPSDVSKTKLQNGGHSNDFANYEFEKTLTGFLEEAESVLYEAPSDATVSGTFH